MAQYVMVKNCGRKKYVESFDGKEIVIPAGGEIKMMRRAAIKFLGTMSAPGYIDENGSVDMSRPQEKKLKIIPISGEKPEPEAERFVCNLDGKEFDSQDELDEHLKEVSRESVIMDEDTGEIKRRM